MPDIRVERIGNRLMIYDRLGVLGYVEIPEGQVENVLDRIEEEW